MACVWSDRMLGRSHLIGFNNYTGLAVMLSDLGILVTIGTPWLLASPECAVVEVV